MLRTNTKVIKLCLYLTIPLLAFCLPSFGQIVVIWPGDTNLDGIVNSDDVLNIGLAFGAQGPPRPAATTQFIPQQALQWGQHLPVSGLDYAAIDCDGNGQIDELDMIAIEQNYLLTQMSNVIPQIFDTLLVPAPAQLNFVLNKDTVGFGDSVMILIDVESPDFPVFPDSVVYGISFTVNYDVFFTKDDATSLSFPDTWLGEPGSSIPFGRIRTDTIQAFAKSSFVPGEAGKVDLAKVRTDSTNKKGTGEEFGVCIVMDENIFKPSANSNAIVMPMEISFSDIKMISLNERIIPVAPFNDIIYIFKPGSCDTGTTVQNLSVSNLTTTSVTLNWDTVPDAAGYEISGGLASQPPSTFVTIGVGGGSTSSFDVIELQPGTSYQWQIMPFCNNGLSGSPSSIHVFNTDICQIPEPIFSNVMPPNSVMLNWTPVNGAFGYQISGGELGSTANVVLNIPNPLQDQITINDLAPSTTYRWEIRAACGSLSNLIWSDYSNQNIFSIPGATPIYTEKSGQIEQFNSDYFIYPNPAHAEVNISLQRNETDPIHSIAIYDLAGKLIYKETISIEISDNKVITLSNDNFFSGIYNILLQSDHQIYVDKLVIIN